MSADIIKIGMINTNLEQMIRLTVVTATYNVVNAGRARVLERCVRSVAALKTPHEHLIYDGASNDGTAILLRDLEKIHSGLKVLSEPDAGIYDALNKGVRDAKGEWFYVLGDDDYIEDAEELSYVMRRAEQESADVVVASVNHGGRGVLFTSRKELSRLFSCNQYSHQGMIVKTKLLRQLGGFDLHYRICADYKMALQLQSMGVKHLYSFKSFAFYSEGGISEYRDAEARREMALALSELLHLTKEEEIRQAAKRILPIMKVLPYLFHRNKYFRWSALNQIVRRICDLVGLINEKGQLSWAKTSR